MPRHQGVWNQQWMKCDRCTFDYPIGSLTKQKGLMLCPKCIDNLDVELRPLLIAELLSDGEENTNERTYLGDNQDELTF
jgi:hypothetical protein